MISSCRRGVVLSLFDWTGVMVQPWADAGYEAWIVDIEHPSGITRDEGVVRVGADMLNGWLPPAEIVGRIRFVSAFPPCDHLAVSGARWFRGKGLRALQRSVGLFATAAEICEWSGAPYLIENPVSTISTYWRKPDHRFHPHDYGGYAGGQGDGYTKLTCLWTGGGFEMPDPRPISLCPDSHDRIHKCPPGPGRARLRSATPRGFASAVFMANSRVRQP